MTQHSTEIENILYRSGLTAQGSWDHMDDYQREAVVRAIEITVDRCCDIVNDLQQHRGPGLCDLADSLARIMGR